MPIFHTAHLRVREDIIERFRDRLLRHARISLEGNRGAIGSIFTRKEATRRFSS